MGFEQSFLLAPRGRALKLSGCKVIRLGGQKPERALSFILGGVPGVDIGFRQAREEKTKEQAIEIYYRDWRVKYNYGVITR